MAKTKFAIAAILVAGALSTPLIVQQQAITRARAENSALEARLRDLPTPSASTIPSANAEDAARRKRGELERLRAEAAALRTRISELAAQAQRADAANLSSKVKGTPIGETVNWREARDVGQATPAAAIQTFVASIMQRDTNRLAQLVEFDPATDPAVMLRQWQEVAQAFAADFASETNAGFAQGGPKEVRLLEEQPAENNDHWIVTQDMRNDSSVGAPERIKFRQTEAGWKLVLGADGWPVTEPIQDQP